MKHFYRDLKLGILGGGQLGRMLIQSGIDLNISIDVLDPDPNAPCKSLATEFTCGKLTDYDTVIAFGQKTDVITVEIENVNTEALEELQKRGVKVFPQPSVIRLIQDKRKQKQFYKDKGIPTSDFILTENAADVRKNLAFLPAFHKLATEGYDGRGVQRIASEADLPRAFDKPGLLEKLVDFDKEISVIVARNEKGETRAFPAVELSYHPEQNLVEFLFSPANISPEAAQKAEKIALDVINGLEMVGILAVEMFLTKNGDILVNEVAPRPHNSGHHSIEANVTSQYEQHLRAVLGLPLGDTAIRRPAAMINLLGEDGYEGLAKYEGIYEVLAQEGVHIHLYGKKHTKPFRKMGHVTISAGNDLEELKEKARWVKDTLRVIA